MDALIIRVAAISGVQRAGIITHLMVYIDKVIALFLTVFLQQIVERGDLVVVQPAAFLFGKHGGGGLKIQLDIRGVGEDALGELLCLLHGILRAVGADIVHPQHHKHLVRAGLFGGSLAEDRLALIGGVHRVRVIKIPQRAVVA